MIGRRGTLWKLCFFDSILSAWKTFPPHLITIFMKTTMSMTKMIKMMIKTTMSMKIMKMMTMMDTWDKSPYHPPPL